MEPLTKLLWSHLCHVAAPMPEVPLLELPRLCDALADNGAIADQQSVRRAVVELIVLGAVCHMDNDEKSALQTEKRRPGSYVIVLYPGNETMYFKIKSREALKRQLILERDALSQNLYHLQPEPSEPTAAEGMGMSCGLTQSQMAQLAAGRSRNRNWNDLVGRDEAFLLAFWKWACASKREDEKQRFVDFLSHVHQNQLEARRERAMYLQAQQDNARHRLSDINTLLADPILSASLDDGTQLIERMAIPLDVQRQVWRRDQGRCVYCSNQENLEFDHIIPVAKGGSSTVRNIQLLCQSCNRKKSAEI
jgi:HNH endonuclease